MLQGAVNLPLGETMDAYPMSFRHWISANRNGGEVMLMSTYEVLSLIIYNGMFLLALLTYINSRDKQK